MNAYKPPLNLILLDGIPIFEQLKIEEALLRATSENWCLINRGSSIPSIVMGLSTHPSDVIHLDDLQSHRQKAASSIPVIRRFSGGGTVIVDENTLFFTLISSDSVLTPEAKGPREAMKWAHAMIAPAFHPEALLLMENDFAIGQHKVGGNAQCFVQGRFLHHTSFLWSWKEERMRLLSHPKKAPEYRQGRDHESFCTKLSSSFCSLDALINGLISQVETHYHIAKTIQDHTLFSDILCLPHRKVLEHVHID